MTTAAAVQVRDRILQAVEDQQDSWEQDDRPRLSATGNCLRANYYKITNEARARIEATGIWEMNDGDIHELDLVRRFEQAGYTIGRRTEEEQGIHVALPNGRKVLGHCDGDVVGNELTAPHIFEAKSMSFMRYSSFVKNGLFLSHPDYYMQIQGYMLGERQKGQDYAGVVIAAKAKDSSATKRPLIKVEGANPKLHVEIVKFNAQAAEQVIDRWMTVIDGVAEGVPPDREYTKSDWQCKWCSFSRQCWGEQLRK